MTKIRKCFVWVFMLSKRLLLQWSFVVLLCLIPVSVILANVAMSRDSGILYVMLCNEDGDETARGIIGSLMTEESVIMFSECSSEAEAREAVEKHEADVAWIFPKRFGEKVTDFVSGKDKDPFVYIIEREKTVPNSIAREKLFGAIYEDYSRAIYESFSYEEIVSRDEVSPEAVRRYYDAMRRRGDIIRIQRLDASENQESKVNYLTAPIRGILSLMIVLCTLAAAMYFLKEQSDGKFAWLTPRKRIIPAFASCISAAFLSAVAVFGALWFSGISMGLGIEMLSMFLFIISASGFCLLISVFFKSPGKFAALIPGLLIMLLVLSPIFFNVKVLAPIRLMLPTHYYLQSVFNIKYCLYTVVYIVAVYAAAFGANYILAERKNS